MRRPLAILLPAILVPALLLVCSPSRLLGGDSLSRYVSDVRGPLEDLAGWAQEVLVFSNEALKTHDAESICSGGVSDDLASRGEAIIAELQAVTPPRALAALHNAARSAAQSVVDSLDKSVGLICEGKDIEGGLRALEEASGTIESLLGRLQDLQKALPGS